MEAMTGVQGHNAAVGCLPYGSGNDFLRTWYSGQSSPTSMPSWRAEVTIDLLETSLGLSATICAAGLDRRTQVAYGIPKFRRIPLCGGEVSYLLSIVEQLCGWHRPQVGHHCQAYREAWKLTGLPDVRHLPMAGAYGRRLPCRPPEADPPADPAGFGRDDRPLEEWGS